MENQAKIVFKTLLQSPTLALNNTHSWKDSHEWKEMLPLFYFLWEVIIGFKRLISLSALFFPFHWPQAEKEKYLHLVFKNHSELAFVVHGKDTI